MTRDSYSSCCPSTRSTHLSFHFKLIVRLSYRKNIPVFEQVLKGKYFPYLIALVQKNAVNTIESSLGLTITAAQVILCSVIHACRVRLFGGCLARIFCYKFKN